MRAETPGVYLPNMMSHQETNISRRQALAIIAGTTGSLALARGGATEASASTTRGKETRYNIVYKLNGGENPTGQVTDIVAGKSLDVAEIKDPSRHGYVFMGWYKDAKLKTPASAVYGKKAADRRTLYARWQLGEYKISYRVKGGSPLFEGPSRYNMNTATFYLPGAQRSGYAFGGWYTDAKFSQDITKVAKGSAGDLRLYAKWNRATYWESHLNRRIEQVNWACETAGATGDSFVFLTDAHVPDNVLYLSWLVEQIRERTPVSTVVFGGDAINWSTTKDEAIKQLGCLKSALSGSGTTYCVRGNHDGNDQGHVGSSAALTDEEYREALFGSHSYVEKGKFYYYRDNEDSKVRHFFLDTGHPSSVVMDDAQLTWLKEHMLELDEGWGIVIFMHEYFSPRKRTTHTSKPLGLHANGTKLNAAIEAVYSDLKAELVCVISGHCHRDNDYRHSFTASDGSRGEFLAFSTTCDAFRQAEKWDDALWGRDRGSVEEQAFDVVTISREERRIYCTRIGCGSSRIFSY